MIGSLRFRAVLEEKMQTPDDGGGFAESWLELATVFAAVDFLRGREQMSGGQIVSAGQIKLRIRYRDDVTPALRLRLKGRIYAIDWVSDPDGRRHWLDLGCTESLPS